MTRNGPNLVDIPFKMRALSVNYAYCTSVVYGRGRPFCLLHLYIYLCAQLPVHAGLGFAHLPPRNLWELTFSRENF